MKLHTLELEGFGPFCERQVVNFDAFADDGIFLIAGRTGAGKSSILDGVCFALYGGVPRYDGGEKRLRSDHCDVDDPTEVQLEFTVAGSRWRVTRSPEYPRRKRRGEGFTIEAARAQLEEWVGAEWRGRAAGPRDVALELDDILGLNQDQFLQVILLAQNKFQRFLLARNDERQAVLRTLFGTRRYEDYQEALEQRRRDAERALASVGDTVGMLLGEAERVARDHDLGADAQSPDAATPVADRFEVIERAVQRAHYRAETLVQQRDDADAAHRAATAAHAALSAVHEKQQERVRSRASLLRLEADVDGVAADRGRLERAARAEALRAPMETARRAVDAAELASVAVVDARAAWRADGGEDLDAAALRERVELYTGDLALWRAALDQEREVAVLETRCTQERAEVTEAEQLLAGLDEQRAAIPAELARIDADSRVAADCAAVGDEVRAQLVAVAARLDSARHAERIAVTLRSAEAQHADRLDALGASTSAVAALMRRRLAGYAGELAAALIDDAACAVCGSLDHPNPAPRSHEPVTDDEISAAEARQDAAAAEERTAATAARAARDAHSAAVARAGGQDAAELDIARVTLQAQVDEATAAATRCDALAADRRRLTDLDAATAAERAALAQALDGARAVLAASTAALQVGVAAVTLARGPFESVAARIAATDRARGLARTVVASDEQHASRAASATEALADRDERIAASAFADADEATCALLDAPECAALDARVREHEARLRAEKQRLLELELALADAPEDAVDTAASAAAVSAARENWSRSVDTAAAAAQARTNLRDLVKRAAEAHRATSELDAAHAAIVRLANTVAGRAPNTHRMTLETFVLAAELEEIVTAANLRLHEMSAGRYLLQHSDALARRGGASGLGLEVMDAYTGQARPPQSLSGGETFLASLALALGLAEVVTGRAGGLRLDTLFIDEGFGSLDAETLDLAMRALDELRQGGRVVGVISHVEAMKDQLPAQLQVEATAQGPSVIRQDAAAAV